MPHDFLRLGSTPVVARDPEARRKSHQAQIAWLWQSRPSMSSRSDRGSWSQNEATPLALSYAEVGFELTEVPKKIPTVGSCGRYVVTDVCVERLTRLLLGW